MDSYIQMALRIERENQTKLILLVVCSQQRDHQRLFQPLEALPRSPGLDSFPLVWLGGLYGLRFHLHLLGSLCYSEPSWPQRQRPSAQHGPGLNESEQWRWGKE
jgi:hypothetical protein